jgi:transporter family-2 protein
MIFAYLLVILAGMLLATQPPSTAALAKSSGYASFAALVSFVTGIFVVLIYFFIESHGKIDWVNLKNVPWYGWIGGFIGAYYIICISLFTRDLGASVLVAILIAAQVVVAAILDHFALMDLPERRMTWMRAGGDVLILVGAGLLCFSK